MWIFQLQWEKTPLVFLHVTSAARAISATLGLKHVCKSASTFTNISLYLSHI